MATRITSPILSELGIVEIFADFKNLVGIDIEYERLTKKKSGARYGYIDDIGSGWWTAQDGWALGDAQIARHLAYYDLDNLIDKYGAHRSLYREHIGIRAFPRGRIRMLDPDLDHAEGNFKDERIWGLFDLFGKDNCLIQFRSESGNFSLLYRCPPLYPEQHQRIFTRILESAGFTVKDGHLEIFPRVDRARRLPFGDQIVYPGASFTGSYDDYKLESAFDKITALSQLECIDIPSVLNKVESKSYTFTRRTWSDTSQESGESEPDETSESKKKRKKRRQKQTKSKRKSYGSKNNTGSSDDVETLYNEGLKEPGIRHNAQKLFIEWFFGKGLNEDETYLKIEYWYKSGKTNGFSKEWNWSTRRVLRALKRHVITFYKWLRKRCLKSNKSKNKNSEEVPPAPVTTFDIRYIIEVCEWDLHCAEFFYDLLTWTKGHYGYIDHLFLSARIMRKFRRGRDCHKKYVPKLVEMGLLKCISKWYAMGDFCRVWQVNWVFSSFGSIVPLDLSFRQALCLVTTHEEIRAKVTPKFSHDTALLINKLRKSLEGIELEDAEPEASGKGNGVYDEPSHTNRESSDDDEDSDEKEEAGSEEPCSQDSPCGDAQAAHKGKTTHGGTDNVESYYVDSPGELSAALVPLSDAPVLGIDTETTGLDPYKSKIRMVQIAKPGHPVVIVDLNKFTTDAQLTPLKTLLASSESVKVFHNAKFDLKMLRIAGFSVGGQLFDTMIAHQLLSAGKGDSRASLDVLVSEYLNLSISKSEQNSDWSVASLSAQQLAYAATDAWVLLGLRDALIGHLCEAKLVSVAELEFNCVRAVVEMELAGMPIDLDKLAVLRGETKERIAVVAAELISHFGTAINLNSTQQLQVAFAKLGIKLSSTARDALLHRVSEHPAIPLLIEYKRLSKLNSSFLERYPGCVNQVTGRIHANYWQCGSVSGRFRCSDPNLQQVPRDPLVRGCFAPSLGNVFVIADYSQIEVRVAAEISGDERMIEAYQCGEDLHTLTASLVQGVPIEEVTKEQRQAAKAVNFGLIFGMGAPRLKGHALKKFGVQMTLDEARTFRERFFEAYPGLKAWHQSVNKQLTLESRTLIGRRRVFASGTKLKNTELYNHPVQGTAADIMKIALARLPQALLGTGAQIVGTVHDEIILEVDEENAQRAAEILTLTMETAGSDVLKRVPVVAEARIARSWAEKSGIELSDAEPEASGERKAHQSEKHRICALPAKDKSFLC